MFLEWESNSGKLQIISGKFQNNAINDVKQISLTHVIKNSNLYLFIIFFLAEGVQDCWKKDPNRKES